MILKDQHRTLSLHCYQDEVETSTHSGAAVHPHPHLKRSYGKKDF